ncbi:hypothetical protein H0H87_012310 [Tephrocybe sp. NHM501043]|nr:hypothetical protein H0H87_012310 [Tephrocybe sp. NHM501043]
MSKSIPNVLLEQLEQVEPGVEFKGTLPRVQSSSGTTYFVKTGTLAEQEQYTGEAESLKAIDAAAPELAPRVISTFTDWEMLVQRGWQQDLQQNCMSKAVKWGSGSTYQRIVASHGSETAGLKLGINAMTQ